MSSAKRGTDNDLALFTQIGFIQANEPFEKHNPHFEAFAQRYQGCCWYNFIARQKLSGKYVCMNMGGQHGSDHKEQFNIYMSLNETSPCKTAQEIFDEQKLLSWHITDYERESRLPNTRISSDGAVMYYVVDAKSSCKTAQEIFDEPRAQPHEYPFVCPAPSEAILLPAADEEFGFANSKHLDLQRAIDVSCSRSSSVRLNDPLVCAVLKTMQDSDVSEPGVVLSAEELQLAMSR
jgi:hypothetical protein